MEAEEQARLEAEQRLAALDEERRREATRIAQAAAAAAAAHSNSTNQPVAQGATTDATIKTFLREQDLLRKEVEAASAKFDDARRKGTPEEISEAGKVLKGAKTRKRQHYNHTISRCVWPEVYSYRIYNMLHNI